MVKFFYCFTVFCSGGREFQINVILYSKTIFDQDHIMRNDEIRLSNSILTLLKLPLWLGLVMMHVEVSSPDENYVLRIYAAS
jgi:hypothetical protein